ncbi:MAG: alanyl-tRNA editing protein [Candidatus Marsarchaeota archaeon]|nr:alanyl-tRNA editing protein [Candidatus Marsarchaeota archaeon]
MTEKIYLKNSYAKEIETSVVETRGNSLILEKTVFYPTGGGQPADTGSISQINGGEVYNIIDVKKDGDEVVHVSDREIMFSKGDKVVCKLNWEKRYMHMRLHTMLHIIDGVVFKKYSGDITGGQIYDNSARMDFDIPNFTREMLDSIIRDSQSIIDEGHNVVAKELTKEEASKISGIARTVPGAQLLEKLDVVRIIDIEGFDFQLDGGTHVANTKEVGKINLVKFENKGSHNKRVEFSLS